MTARTGIRSFSSWLTQAHARASSFPLLLALSAEAMRLFDSTIPGGKSRFGHLEDAPTFIRNVLQVCCLQMSLGMRHTPKAGF